jgi:cytochrome P450 family 6
MSSNVFALPGEAWKSLRARLTPAFTVGKIKGMYPMVQIIGDSFVNLLKPLSENNDTIDIRDLAGRYALDCFAAISFGQRGVSTIDNPKHQFRAKAIEANDSTDMINVILRSAAFVCPG